MSTLTMLLNLVLLNLVLELRPDLFPELRCEFGCSGTFPEERGRSLYR